MRKNVIGLAAFLAAIAAVHFAFPAAAAATCPSCYGFSGLGDGIFAQTGLSAEQRNQTKEIIQVARSRVKAFYGSLAADPRILICPTESCYRPLGGGSRGISLLDQALVLSPRGLDVVIASHELAHAELHRRIGLWATLSRSIPQWFDEGLAVVVSDDPRYLLPATQGDRCKAEPDADLPTSRSAWIETAQSAGLYAQAACKVNRWLGSHDGRDGVLRLAVGVAKGTPFNVFQR